MIISKSERYFVLIVIFIGVCLTGISYYHKKTSIFETKPAEFNEPRNLININIATRLELERLHGIGPALAERIVSYREEIGGFKSIEDLKNVKGIGDGKFEEIRNFITIAEGNSWLYGNIYKLLTRQHLLR